MGGAQSYGDHAEGARAAVDDRGAGRVEGDRQGEQRAGGSGAAGHGRAGRGWWRDLLGGGASGGVSESASGHVSGAAVQSRGAGGAGDRRRAGTAPDLRRGGAWADRGDGAAAAGAEGGWDGNLVVEHPGADAAAGGAPARRRDDDSAGAPGRGLLVPADADLVPDRHRAAEAQGRGGAGGRSADGRKKGAI